MPAASLYLVIATTYSLVRKIASHPTAVLIHKTGPGVELLYGSLLTDCDVLVAGSRSLVADLLKCHQTLLM